MNIRLIKRRAIWWPTWSGWIGLLALLGTPAVVWWFQGESFLATNEHLPAEGLVVEGWIGIEGVQAAKAEFESGGYRFIITAGGPTSNRWGSQRWNYAIEAADLLVRLGVPADKVIAAPAPEVGNNRTFESALVVRQALETHHLHPPGVNVMTIGVHARRSRLVFAKALAPGTTVGAISWLPVDYRVRGPWWKSSERALDLIKETVGYFFEALLNSGRSTNAPDLEKP